MAKLIAFAPAALLLIVAWTSSCSRETEHRVSPLPVDATILAFGDSITFGLGAKRHESYPAHLETFTSRKVINAGEPNELAAKALNRLKQALALNKVSLVILCHGGNDLLISRETPKVKESLSSLINFVREQNIPILLVAVPEPKNVSVPAPIYMELATQYEIPIEMEALPRLYSNPAAKSDKIHLNAVGYLELAKAVHIKLKELGYIKQ